MSCAGRAVHQSCERGVRVHAGPGTGRRAGGHGTRTAGGGAHVPVLGVLVHGQRDIVPAEAVPGGGQPGRVLGPVPGHRAHHVGQDVAHQRRARVLHRDLYRAQGVRHAQHGVADGVMSVAAAAASARGNRNTSSTKQRGHCAHRFPTRQQQWPERQPAEAAVASALAAAAATAATLTL